MISVAVEWIVNVKLIVKFSTHRDILDQKHQKQNGKWNNNVGESSKGLQSYYIKLAPESPRDRISDVQHDESSYDSFHNYETGESSSP